MSSVQRFPGFDALYSIHDPVAGRVFRGDFSRVRETAGILRGEIRVDDADPVQVAWAMGSPTPGDIIWTTAANVIIASTRVIDLLITQRFTGWTTYPVSVRGKRGEAVDGFHGLAITGRCGPRDYTRSEVVLREYPGGWFPHLRGCYVEEASWDGSDFFMEQPDDRGKVNAAKYVTEQVWHAFRNANVRNIRFERLSDEETGLNIIEVSSAYRLPVDIKDRVARARRAGPLGAGA